MFNSQIGLFFIDEWRYWLRSRLATSSLIIFSILLLSTSIITTYKYSNERSIREDQQNLSENTFLNQPDRHPHRMVHYGHYLFRVPAPLAIFDPGLDSVTGQSIFLEGHRQNSATFSESASSSDLPGLSRLTPALIYQLISPLLIILVGYSSVIRERETKLLRVILAQGVSGSVILVGKALAMISLVFLMVLPILIIGTLILADEESFLTISCLCFVYFLYLSIWSFFTIFVSAMMTRRSEALSVLIPVWIFHSVVSPAIAINFVSRTIPLEGQISSDFEMRSEKRKLGDGHNINDPAFAQFRSEVMQKYNVDQIEDLPINFRGLVAMRGEEQLSKMMNEYASQRMQVEQQQQELLNSFAWINPTLAIVEASRILSGTDLEHYHRFINDAEAIRYEFVQGLNEAHSEHLSFQADINRNKSKEWFEKARVSSDHWSVLDDYQFKVDNDLLRARKMFPLLNVLLSWLLLLMVLLYKSTKKLR